MLRREIERSEMWKSDYIKTKVEAQDYKLRYCKLLNKWNDLIPTYNKLVDIKKEYNELKEDNKEIQEHLDDNWEYIERLHEEIAELKKIKLKDE